jgi:hypothetical protein
MGQQLKKFSVSFDFRCYYDRVVFRQFVQNHQQIEELQIPFCRINNDEVEAEYYDLIFEGFPNLKVLKMKVNDFESVFHQPRLAAVKDFFIALFQSEFPHSEVEYKKHFMDDGLLIVDKKGVAIEGPKDLNFYL